MLAEEGIRLIVPAMDIQTPVTDAMLDEANRELACYAGAHAMFWKYTATHGRLVIEVRLGEGPCEYWSFCFVDHLCAPTWWRMVRPTVKRRDAKSFIFSDEGVEFVAVELSSHDADG